MFDDKILTALESSVKRAGNFKYKMDYVFPVGDDVFFVGEQYDLTIVSRNVSNPGMRPAPGSAMANNPMYGNNRGNNYEYEYMDVIVAKLNSQGEFEWIRNAPLRNHVKLTAPHVFKQYFAYATSKNIYIFNNDHPKNIERYQKSDFEPRDLKTTNSIHGSIFVFSSISTTDGAIRHKLIFENETYCFAPIQERNASFMPPEEAEIFVPGNNNELFVYTEDRGLDRFSRLTIVE